MDHLRARPIRPFLMIRSVTLRRKQPLTLRTRPTTRSIGREIPGPRSRVGGARRRPTPGSTAAGLTIRAGEQIRRRRASQGLWGSESPVETGEIPGSKNRRHGVGEDMGEGGGVGHVVGDPDHGAVGRAHAARLKHVADEQGLAPVEAVDALPRVGVPEEEALGHLLLGVVGVAVELQADASASEHLIASAGCVCQVAARRCLAALAGKFEG